MKDLLKCINEKILTIKKAEYWDILLSKVNSLSLPISQILKILKPTSIVDHLEKPKKKPLSAKITHNRPRTAKMIFEFMKQILILFLLQT